MTMIQTMKHKFLIQLINNKFKVNTMKSKYVMLASAMLISVATFAQKEQIKAAEKALKGGNSQEAATILQGAESLLTNDADKAHKRRHRSGDGVNIK